MNSNQTSISVTSEEAGRENLLSDSEKKAYLEKYNAERVYPVSSDNEVREIVRNGVEILCPSDGAILQEEILTPDGLRTMPPRGIYAKFSYAIA